MTVLAGKDTGDHAAVTFGPCAQQIIGYRLTEGRVPPAGSRHQPLFTEPQNRAAMGFLIGQFGVVAFELRRVQVSGLNGQRSQQHLRGKPCRTGLAPQCLNRRCREPLGPDAVALSGHNRTHQPLEPGQKPVLTGIGIEAVPVMRRAKIELGTAGRQHEVDFRQPLAQTFALFCRRRRVGYLHIVTDNQIGPAAGDIGLDSARHDRGVAQFQFAADGEPVIGPLIARSHRHQVSGQGMALNHPADIAHHLASQRLIRRQHEDAQIVVERQPPCAIEAGERGLAAATECHDQQAAVALNQTLVEPASNIAVNGRCLLRLYLVPGGDEQVERDHVA